MQFENLPLNGTGFKRTCSSGGCFRRVGEFWSGQVLSGLPEFLAAGRVGRLDQGVAVCSRMCQRRSVDTGRMNGVVLNAFGHHFGGGTLSSPVVGERIGELVQQAQVGIIRRLRLLQRRVIGIGRNGSALVLRMAVQCGVDGSGRIVGGAQHFPKTTLHLTDPDADLDGADCFRLLYTYPGPVFRHPPPVQYVGCQRPSFVWPRK